MTEASATLTDISVLVRRRETLLVGGLTFVVAALVLALGPSPGDAPAHLYRTLLVRHGALVWDNYWYAGTYPLGTYSLLYYLPAAVVGNIPLVFAASVVSTMLFSSIAFRQWGAAALWPARTFGVLAAAPMFTGLFAYTLGFTAMLATLRALQARRTWLAIVLAGITVGFSPLAFVFLGLILGSILVSQRRLPWRWPLLLAGLAAAAAVQLLALARFSTPTGSYPFHWSAFSSVLAVCALGVLVARRADAGAPFVAFYLLWGIGSVVLFLVPTPLGDNWTRLSAFAFPLMLITAATARFRPRRLVSLALLVALAYNIVPYFLLIPYRLDGRPEKAAFWEPALAYLQRHSTPGFRVEVVPTAAHWEAYWLPKAGFPLARGWYRQLDVANNPVLYRKHLEPAAYRSWLRSAAVEYVLLAATPLDWEGGPQEARILREGRAGLKVAFRSPSWTVYRLPNPTPIVTGPGRARVTQFGHATIRGVVSAPGRYLVRVHYNPYWRLDVAGCVLRAPQGMMWVVLKRAGPFGLSVPSSAREIVESLSDKRALGC